MILVRRAFDVPGLDINGLSDPYVVLWVSTSSGVQKGSKVQTHTRWDTAHPVWMSYRHLEVSVAPDDILHIEMWDEDKARWHDQIGSAQLPIRDFTGIVSITVQQTVKALKKNTQNTAMVLELERVVAGTPCQKSVFLIRHGQSTWNEAKARMNLVAMGGNVDHPLTLLGVTQAQNFNKRWKVSSLKGQAEAQFMCATAVYSSPLTRALQTSVLGLAGHPALQEKGVTLMRNIREEQLGALIGHEEAAAVMPNKINLNDTIGTWCSPGVNGDTKDDINDRIHELLHHIRFHEDEVSIVVGHSRFLHLFCKAFASAELEATSPQMYLRCTKHKLRNVGCARIVLDFSQVVPRIVDASAVFGAAFDIDEETTLRAMSKIEEAIDRDLERLAQEFASAPSTCDL